MNTITHQPEESDEATDEFCRDVIKMARASDQEINAALNAPFLYPRIRARINTERESRHPGLVAAERPQGRSWSLGSWGWQWRWALAGAALVLLTLSGWRWFQASPAAPLIARTQPAPPTAAVPAPVTEADALPLPAAKARVVAKALPAKPVTARRQERRLTEDDSEVATDYMPLTYVANSEEQSGQVVRVEMPRSAMLALGLPVNAEPTSEVVKADVIVGDDGLALAIRFVHTTAKRSE